MIGVKTIIAHLVRRERQPFPIESVIAFKNAPRLALNVAARRDHNRRDGAPAFRRAARARLHWSTAVMSPLTIGSGPYRGIINNLDR
jgi:hypothetical protein